ncbi:superoxide dismutase family protein [Quatrionicoccus australiensis]|uniref:superoxide dismutase family protein n=1 Tax=Quatrionicoccus australiensis TaxID=138118 RepID=UPI001CFA7D41|nr:superoxide dismutase family protein [Quatrionicoccus australiensis]MCB4361710.1 superoxide dismutase family protein [Quatrionicoccus australiensis]
MGAQNAHPLVGRALIICCRVVANKWIGQKVKKFILLVVVSFGLLAGCRGGFIAPPALRAEAVLVAGSAGKIGGAVSFSPVGNRLRVIADLSGMPPGAHAFQIARGGCAESKGDGAKGVVALPAIVADSAGAARLTAYLAGVELGGEGENIIGRSVRVYDRPDYADGKSDALIACAVIMPK